MPICIIILHFAFTVENYNFFYYRKTFLSFHSWFKFLKKSFGRIPLWNIRYCQSEEPSDGHLANQIKPAVVVLSFMYLGQRETKPSVSLTTLVIYHEYRRSGNFDMTRIDNASRVQWLSFNIVSLQPRVAASEKHITSFPGATRLLCIRFAFALRITLNRESDRGIVWTSKAPRQGNYRKDDEGVGRQGWSAGFGKRWGLAWQMRAIFVRGVVSESCTYKSLNRCFSRIRNSRKTFSPSSSPSPIRFRRSRRPLGNVRVENAWCTWKSNTRFCPTPTLVSRVFPITLEKLWHAFFHLVVL